MTECVLCSRTIKFEDLEDTEICNRCVSAAKDLKGGDGIERGIDRKEAAERIRKNVIAGQM